LGRRFALKFKDILQDRAVCHGCAKQRCVGNALPGTPILPPELQDLRACWRGKGQRARLGNHGSKSGPWMAKKGRVGKVFQEDA